jgi:hypothetical protein
MTPDISKLNLDTAASLQQQKQEEARKPKKGAKAPAQEPLAAPQPTRAKPTPGMWKEGMEIRFGENAPTQKKEDDGKGEKASKTSGKQGWDPNQEIRFG